MPSEDEDTESPDLSAGLGKAGQSWATFSQANAWDEIPEIGRYIGKLQKSRRGNVQVLHDSTSDIPQVPSPDERISGMKLTDFPTELERPSLPVTPAPIRRPSFWGEERDEKGELPAAQGVPSQEDWVSFLVLVEGIALTITRTLHFNWNSSRDVSQMY